MHIFDVNRPSPTLAELEEASLAYCSMPWSELDDKTHEYTRSYQKHARCLEALYLVTLLQQVSNHATSAFVFV